MNPTLDLETKKPKRRQSFRVLLLKRLTIAGLSITIVAAFIYSFVSSNVVEEFYKKEGFQATENFAQLSELALLYDSGENGREAAIATLNFPSIKHVAIINNNSKILFSEGNTHDPTISSLSEIFWSDKTTHIIASTSSTWNIVAPVFTSYEDEDDMNVMLDTEVSEKKYLGYVAVQVDAGTVNSAKNDLFLKNMTIGLSYGIMFLFVINAALSKLLKPMSSLAKVMDRSRDGSYIKSKISTDVSLEIHTMSGTYNQMISALGERDQKLRNQKELLETEVSLRTSELIQARDAALEANRHKSEFLANVTHELRTPLQSILGYTELLSETLDDDGIDSCNKDIEKITRNATHLLDLINSILDISKIEAGKMDVHAEETDIPGLLNSATDTIKHLLEKNNNKLHIKLGDFPDNIFLDKKKVYQIILNLLSNAAKFTHNGIITVESSIENSILKVSIHDTGVGMTQTQQKIIFEPFRQIDGSESRNFIGTGLGLSIVLRFTEILGGQVRLDSELDRGSCFTIELPIESEEKNYELIV